MVRQLMLFLGLIMATLGVAHPIHDDALIRVILANEESCVQKYDDDKIYLNPEHLVPAKNGLFLNVNGMSIPIHSLFADEDGCYVAPLGKFDILNKCKGCGYEYFVYCRTPGCPYNPDTQKDR